jgi:hypothetical protein
MMPRTTLGKWSVGLNAFFLIVVALSLFLVATGALSFDATWWDVTVPVLVVATLAAFITGILALRKEQNGLVIASVVLSSCAILFCLLHSLFIND